jgi:hypothetical protein
MRNIGSRLSDVSPNPERRQQRQQSLGRKRRNPSNSNPPPAGLPPQC